MTPRAKDQTATTPDVAATAESCWTRTRRDRTRQDRNVLLGLPLLQDRESDMSDLGRMLAELRANRG